MDNTPLTLDEINEMLNRMEGIKPDIHMNQKTYDSLDVPDEIVSLNIKINNYLQDNEALVLPAKEKEIRIKFV